MRSAARLTRSGAGCGAAHGASAAHAFRCASLERQELARRHGRGHPGLAAVLEPPLADGLNAARAPSSASLPVVPSSNGGMHLRQWSYIVSASCRRDAEAFGQRHKARSHSAVGTQPAEATRSISQVDVVTLGNLCVDVVVNVPALPAASRHEKWEYMQRLSATPPDESAWEGGGNSNFAITAARLGLRCVALGHLGKEVFGNFMLRVLASEGIKVVEIGDEVVGPLGEDDYDGQTLVCWVMVDPQKRHAFSSRFDFNESPAFSRIRELPATVDSIVRRAKALVCNGFVFDELQPATILASIASARSAGCAIFFDPGPRARSLSQGTAEQRDALKRLLCLSNVVLLTANEAEALTGIKDPVKSGKDLLGDGGSTEWVVVKRGEMGCILVTREDVYAIPGFKGSGLRVVADAHNPTCSLKPYLRNIEVDVVDTVGCGDSFGAAIVLGYAGGNDPCATIALANAVGAATAMGSGAGRNVANAKQVEEILRRVEEGSLDVHDVCTGLVDQDDILRVGCGGCDAISLPKIAQEARMMLEASLERRGQANY